MTGERGATPGLGDLYDPAALAAAGQPGGGVRLPDGRALSWAEYGSTRGVPCLLLPDTGSSRLAPLWLLHGTTPPAQVRPLVVDRPGVGDSDPVGLGGQQDLVQDLHHLLNTLAVGRVAVIGVGQGASDAMAFAAGYATMVSTVLAISPRMTTETAPGRTVLPIQTGQQPENEGAGIPDRFLPPEPRRDRIDPRAVLVPPTVRFYSVFRGQRGVRCRLHNHR